MVFYRDCSSKISKSQRRSLAWLIQSDVRCCSASSSISMHFCPVQPIASCDSRWTWSLRNRSWIHLKCSPWESTFLQHLFHEFHATWYSFCSLLSFFWIRFQRRTVRKCSRQPLDSNWEDTENIVLLVLFRTTRRTLHCQVHGSSPSNFCWMCCRRYSAASRHGVLLDEDDFRSYWQALERGNFLSLSQLHVPMLVPWSRCWVLPPGWTLVHPRVSPFLLSAWCPRDQTSHLFRSPVNCCSPTGLTVLDKWVFGFGWIRWVSLLLPAISESNSLI